MKQFVELKLQAQQDSFGEKRRHFDLTAAGKMEITAAGLPHSFDGRFVHRQTKPNPYSRAQMLVMELDSRWYYPQGIPYSKLTIGGMIQLKPKGETAVSAQVVRRWWEPVTRTDFAKLEPFQLKDGSLIPLAFRFAAQFEADWLFLGSQAGSMDEKWQILGERPWVYWYRSWTGLPVFATRVEQLEIAEAYVFTTALKEGVAPSSVVGSLRSLLQQTVQDAQYVVDTVEARQILHRFGRKSI